MDGSIRDLRSKRCDLDASVVIVNWNGREHLVECLDALRSQDYPAKQFQTILVDNGSKDDSIALARARYPEVLVLENDRNNYASANNLGIRRTHSRFVALLNNDTHVEPDWLSQLIDTAEKDPQAGAVGSKIRFWDGRINSTGVEELPNYHWRDRGFGEEDRGQYDQRESVAGLSGCAVLFRRDAMERVGLFDEDFEMYYEDIDMSFRLRAAGYSLIYEPKSSLSHRYNASISKVTSTKKDEYGERNRLFVLARHFPDAFPAKLTESRYFLESRSRELKKTLPILLHKWSEAGVDACAMKDLARLLTHTKHQYLKLHHRVKGLRRDILHRDREKIGILEDLEKETQRHETESRETHSAYHGSIQTLEEERDQARAAFENERNLRDERERWIDLLLGEIKNARWRSLHEGESHYLDSRIKPGADSMEGQSNSSNSRSPT